MDARKPETEAVKDMRMRQIRIIVISEYALEVTVVVLCWDERETRKGGKAITTVGDLDDVIFVVPFTFHRYN